MKKDKIEYIKQSGLISDQFFVDNVLNNLDDNAVDALYKTLSRGSEDSISKHAKSVDLAKLEYRINCAIDSCKNYIDKRLDRELSHLPQKYGMYFKLGGVVLTVLGAIGAWKYFNLQEYVAEVENGKSELKSLQYNIQEYKKTANEARDLALGVNVDFPLLYLLRDMDDVLSRVSFSLGSESEFDQARIIQGRCSSIAQDYGQALSAQQREIVDLVRAMAGGIIMLDQCKSEKDKEKRIEQLLKLADHWQSLRYYRLYSPWDETIFSQSIDHLRSQASRMAGIARFYVHKQQGRDSTLLIRAEIDFLESERLRGVSARSLTNRAVIAKYKGEYDLKSVRNQNEGLLGQYDTGSVGAGRVTEEVIIQQTQQACDNLYDRALAQSNNAYMTGVILNNKMSLHVWGGIEYWKTYNDLPDGWGGILRRQQELIQILPGRSAASFVTAAEAESVLFLADEYADAKKVVEDLERLIQESVRLGYDHYRNSKCGDVLDDLPALGLFAEEAGARDAVVLKRGSQAAYSAVYSKRICDAFK